MKPRLGILAGMGAAAGAYLYSYLIGECQRRGAKRDEDFPEAILYNAPYIGLDELGQGDEEGVKAGLRVATSVFNSLSVDRFLIACNSVSMYHQDLSDRFPNLWIAHLPQLAMAECGHKNMGAITSRATANSGLYNGCMRPTNMEQQAVDGIIRQAIPGFHGRQIELYNDQALIRAIISRMKKAGAEKVILGCTELRLVFPPELDDGIVIDAGEAGVRAMLEGFYEEA